MRSMNTQEFGQVIGMPVLEESGTQEQGSALRKRLSCIPKAHEFLSVGTLSDPQGMRLVDADERYVAWMRVVTLRTVLAGGVQRSNSPRSHMLVTHAEEFWGIENLESYQDLNGASDTYLALKQLLSVWESELPPGMALPSIMQANLQALEQLLELNPIERNIVAFVMLLHGESMLEASSDVLGCTISAHQVPYLLANILDLDRSGVQSALSEGSTLSRTGLVTLDYFSEGTLRSRIDPICGHFAKRMFVRHERPLDIVGDMIRCDVPVQLGHHDLLHVQDRAHTFSAYLQSAQASCLRGANILIYGTAGTGKTQFARYLGKLMGSDMLEIGVGNERGHSVPSYIRFRYYKLAQGLVSKRPSVVLFDECEEVFGMEMVKNLASSDQNLGNKSWVNALLENNRTPTIWIANAIHDFDPALLRRFDLVMEMPLPPQSQRQLMLQSMCEGLVSERMVSQIAASKGSTPAMLAQTSRVLKAVAQGRGASALDGVVSTLVNDRLAVQGLRPIQSKKADRLSIAFDPLLIHTTMPLLDVSAGCGMSGQGRICVFGPSGTGKTAFGKWLAQTLDLPSHFYKSSDLLAPHVGETERNIAAAFSRASREGAVLQMDEVDSFLQERSGARQSWEVSLVNEMLTQLEGFEGVFIASTNRFEQLDAAVLRRFDLSLKFDYLKAPAAWELFQRCCAALAFPMEWMCVRNNLQNSNT